jgi:bifunctional ADP-heptose synthase (sugar kinase/adenylyltransferase)
MADGRAERVVFPNGCLHLLHIGQVKIIPLVEGFSTTSLIARGASK